MKKAVFPDPKVLQPMPAGVGSGASQDLNNNQVQIIKKTLDESGQTLSAQKITENIKTTKQSVFTKSVGVWPWIIIAVLIAVLGFIIFTRLHQKQKK